MRQVTDIHTDLIGARVLYDRLHAQRPNYEKMVVRGATVCETGIFLILQYQTDSGLRLCTAPLGSVRIISVPVDPRRRASAQANRETLRQKRVDEDFEKYKDAALKIDTRVHDYLIAQGVPHKRIYVDYSAYQTDKHDAPIDNLDEVAVRGKVRFRMDCDQFYGGKKSKDYESPVLENPTWLELCKHANDMILATRDRHHCFLEGFDIVGEEGDNVQIAEFTMGS